MTDIKRNSTFLMANLGSEVSRLIMAHEKNDKDLVNGAYNRSLIIFKELYDREDMVDRKTELNNLKKIIDNFVFDNENLEIKINPVHLKAFFMPFALRALAQNNII